jgi:hypothetical protein
MPFLDCAAACPSRGAGERCVEPSEAMAADVDRVLATIRFAHENEGEADGSNLQGGGDFARGRASPGAGQASMRPLTAAAVESGKSTPC